MDPPRKNAADNVSYELDAEDVYKELKLRGTEYYGQFQGVLKADMKGQYGVLKWDNNWVAFIDTMIHSTALSCPRRTLQLPVKMTSCRIDPILHVEMTKKAKEASLDYAFDKHLRMCRSGGHYFASNLETLVEQFSAQCSKQEFVLILMRTAVTPAEQLLLSVGGIQLQVHKEDAVEALFNSHGFTVVGVKSNNFSTLFLLRNTKGTLEAAQPEVVQVSNDNFRWVEEIKRKAAECDQRPHGHTLWLLGEDNGTSGVVGLTNCLRWETERSRIRCILNGCLSESTRSVDFNPKNPMFMKLLKQDLVMNVYRDGQWGSFRDTSNVFRDPQKISTELAFINIQTRGDLSSLQWYESPLRYASPSSYSGRVLCSVYYAPLNFRDVMIATGKLPPDALPSDQANSECLLGLEFSGRDPQGRRVMGFVQSHAMSTTVSADPEFLLGRA
ncbi:hypothetical protein MTO96_035703 [Rhipicephalus appendiculatus]